MTSLPDRIAPYTHHDGRDLGVLDERGGKAAREPERGADIVPSGPRSSSSVTPLDLPTHREEVSEPEPLLGPSSLGREMPRPGGNASPHSGSLTTSQEYDRAAGQILPRLAPPLRRDSR